MMKTLDLDFQDKHIMASGNDELLSGFQINWITLRDIDTGEILWHGNEDYSCPNKKQEIKISRKVLNSRAVSREVNFSSVEGWARLRVVQKIFYKGVIMDELSFEFGAVSPNSCNSWQSIVEAAPEIKLMNVNILSGNLVVETKFYDGKDLITTSTIKLYYI